MPSKDIEETIETAKKLKFPPMVAKYIADDPLPTSTTSSSEVTEEETPPITSSPSVPDVTEPDTGFTGEEQISYALTLSKEDRVKWVMARLDVFRESIVTYAEACQRERRSSKTVSEAEWQAILETEGLTRAIPQEQVAFEWLLREARSDV